MCDGATLDIDNVGWQLELLHDRERYDGEGLVDFNTLDVAVAPAGACKRLFDGRYRTEAKQTRLDRSDAIRREPQRALDHVYLPKPRSPAPSPRRPCSAQGHCRL